MAGPVARNRTVTILLVMLAAFMTWAIANSGPPPGGLGLSPFVVGWMSVALLLFNAVHAQLDSLFGHPVTEASILSGILLVLNALCVALVTVGVGVLNLPPVYQALATGMQTALNAAQALLPPSD